MPAITRYSKYSPSEKILDLLGVDYNPAYPSLINSPRHIDNANNGLNDIRYTPLFLQALKKSLDEVGLDEYNNLLNESVKLSKMDSSNPWFTFQVYLNLYGYKKEAAKLEKYIKREALTSKEDSSGLVHYLDLLHYAFLTSGYTLGSRKTIKFQKLNFYFKGSEYIFKNDKARHNNFMSALKSMVTNYSVSEFLFINHTSQKISGNLFRDSGGGSILFNGAVYQLIMSYNFRVMDEVNKYMNQDVYSNPNIKRIKECINDEHVDFLDFFINEYGIFDNKNDLSITEYSRNLNQIVDRFELLFKSSLPLESWTQYIELPYDWLKGISSDN
jgi:hypothetical protein